MTAPDLPTAEDLKLVQAKLSQYKSENLLLKQANASLLRQLEYQLGRPVEDYNEAWRTKFILVACGFEIDKDDQGWYLRHGEQKYRPILYF
jgi:hypothetical protein